MMVLADNLFRVSLHIWRSPTCWNFAIYFICRNFSFHNSFRSFIFLSSRPWPKRRRINSLTFHFTVVMSNECNVSFCFSSVDSSTWQFIPCFVTLTPRQGLPFSAPRSAEIFMCASPHICVFQQRLRAHCVVVVTTPVWVSSSTTSGLPR